MKQLFILLTTGLFIVFSTMACDNKKEFILNGRYVGHTDYDNYIGREVILYKMIIPSSSSQDIIERKAFKRVNSSIVSKSGEFTFKSSVSPEKPCIYFVGVYTIPEVLFVQSGSVRDWDIQLFVAEPGVITMTLYNGKSEVKGTPINEKLTEIFLNSDALENEIRNSIYQENSEKYYYSEDMEKHPLMQEYKKKMSLEYYVIMKENIDNDISKFLFHAAKKYCTKEQFQEITNLMTENNSSN